MGNNLERRTRLIATVLLFVPAILQFFPIFYLLCISFKIGGEVTQYPPVLLPKQINAANYIDAMNVAPLGRFLLNSFIVAASMTLLQVVTAILAAFALARLEFRGKTIILGLIVATMM